MRAQCNDDRQGRPFSFETTNDILLHKPSPFVPTFVMAVQERLERKLVELVIEAAESEGTQKWQFLRDVIKQLQPQLIKFAPSLKVLFV